MKTFKVSDGKVRIDGVLYGSTPTNDVNIIGKSGGKIHSVMIQGKGQFFPISGLFNDGTTPIVDSTTEVLDEPTTKKKGKLAKTELVESSSKPTDTNGKTIKKSRKTK